MCERILTLHELTSTEGPFTEQYIAIAQGQELNGGFVLGGQQYNIQHLQE